MEYSGSCHCGAVKFSFQSRPIVDGLRCNCSICKRKGAAMTRFTIPPENLQTDDRNRFLSTYQFDDGLARHYFCSRCGIFTYVETRLDPGQFRVNLGCINEIDSFTLPIIMFDGENI